MKGLDEMASCKFCRSEGKRAKSGKWVRFTTDLKYIEVACQEHLGSLKQESEPYEKSFRTDYLHIEPVEGGESKKQLREKYIGRALKIVRDVIGEEFYIAEEHRKKIVEFYRTGSY